MTTPIVTSIAAVLCVAIICLSFTLPVIIKFRTEQGNKRLKQHCDFLENHIHTLTKGNKEWSEWFDQTYTDLQEFYAKIDKFINHQMGLIDKTAAAAENLTKASAKIIDDSERAFNSLNRFQTYLEGIKVEKSNIESYRRLFRGEMQLTRNTITAAVEEIKTATQTINTTTHDENE